LRDDRRWHTRVSGPGGGKETAASNLRRKLLTCCSPKHRGEGRERGWKEEGNGDPLGFKKPKGDDNRRRPVEKTALQEGRLKKGEFLARGIKGRTNKGKENYQDPREKDYNDRNVFTPVGIIGPLRTRKKQKQGGLGEMGVEIGKRNGRRTKKRKGKINQPVRER